MKNKNNTNINASLKLKESFENNFLYSDSIPATASKFLLAALALGPAIVVGSVAPGVFSMLKSFDKKHIYSQQKICIALNNLKQRKFIEIIEEGDEKFKVRLTNKGQKRTKEISFEFLSITKPNKWDGKWRVLVFDIPTNPKIYNQARNALREKIKELGFYQMQKSVWVFPYECEDEILFVAEIFKVQKYIEIMTVEKLLHEEKIRRIFHL